MIMKDQARGFTILWDFIVILYIPQTLKLIHYYFGITKLQKGGGFFSHTYTTKVPQIFELKITNLQIMILFHSDKKDYLIVHFEEINFQVSASPLKQL